MRIETWQNGRVIATEEIPDPPAQAYSISKLKIRRGLRARGLENAFDAALSQYPAARKDWDDAVELMSDDPILAQMLPAFAQALGVAQSEMDALLAEARN